MGLLNKRWRAHAPHAGLASRARPSVEALEARVVPYAVTGNAWPSPQLVTLSFVPDGTILGANQNGYIYSNLFATLNAQFGSAWTWEYQVLLAAQTWAAQTNLNLAWVADNGTSAGGGSYQQGDSGMGDIRIGGYNFGTSDLGAADFPPPANNFSIAGDINLDTGQPFRLGGQPGGSDLYTVIQHELGHALGLGHSSVYNAQMYGTYTGIKWSLNSDDIAGIRNIYSGNAARTQDGWDQWYSNGSISTPTDFTPYLDPTTLIFNSSGNLDITTPSDVDFYRFTVPSGATGSVQIRVQSQGFSLLTPTLTVYNTNQQQIGFVSGANQYGATLNLTVSGFSPGQQIYIRVGGVDSSAFSVGAYALAANFGSSSTPAPPYPYTTKANGSPPSAGGGLPELSPGDQGDPPGGDRFDNPNPLFVTASAAPTSVSQSVRLNGAADLVGVLLATKDRIPTVVVSALPVTPSGTVAVASPLLFPLPLATFPETLRSGGGAEPVNVVLTEDAAVPTPSANEPATPALPECLLPAGEEFRPEQVTPALWIRASENCFTDLGRTATLVETSESNLPAVTGESAPVVDVVALLAGLLGISNGTWRLQPEEIERQRRRRF